MTDIGAPHMETAVAVIGMSCRFPGAATPARFWENLVSGTASIGAVPEERRPAGTGAANQDAPGSAGGFLDDLEQFDADFFGISPREARYLDPQQRLMLALAWECLEDAAVPSADVTGARWGVFVGACADDFRTAYLMSGGLDRFGHLGTSRTMLANRVSHHFGLRGPSEVVDTGQSSSLTAVHRALAALRLGECEAALAAGVNLNLLPEVTEQVRLWGGLSPDGRCHTFDQRANGYVRGEGGGCVLLKPLAAAVRDRDHIYGVLRGSAVNNDGGRDGLAVPSLEAQREVIEAAHTAAGTGAADVVYVELHGTGTPVGDPVEARALGAVAGRARPQGDPVRVGSAKTNIGHLESAAGMAGLIKACLMLHHGVIPPSLNFTRSPDEVPLDALNLRVVTEPEAHPFRPGDAVGVSSFGMGGTNVHVVLGSSPTAGRNEPAEPQDALWCLSGRSPEAVRNLAADLLAALGARPATPAADVAWTLAHRTQGEHRAVVLGSGPEDFRQGLARIVAGNGLAVPGAWLRDAAPARGRLVELAGTYLGSGDLTEITALFAGAARKAALPQAHPFAPAAFPLLHRPAPAPHGGTGEDHPLPPAGPPPAEPWATAPAGPERVWQLAAMLERELLLILGGSVPDLDPDLPFRDYDVDSMTQLEFLERIHVVTGIDLPDTTLFDYPTINELAACVNGKMESRNG
ncbi:beta-ketoacyl synthase N-terminal-like domain-containing protein [Streptomyces sp. NPDC052496]|uniref:beta-ketoacyl synthase N-terminal-like domain-containing protein n=1 Tax=Streptomyces sp. NPDC052496 TaxID=3154951 RepID=UPI003433BE2D